MIIIAQLIGLFGLISHVMSFQQSRRGRVLVLLMVGCIFWAVHFLLLGFYTAAVLNLIAAVRSWVFYKFKDRTNKTLLNMFLLILIVSTLVTWQGPISVLPLLASVFSTYASWGVSAQTIRWLTIPSPVLWFVHNVFAGSIGVIADSMVLSSILVGLYRHRNTRERTDVVLKTTTQKMP